MRPMPNSSILHMEGSSLVTEQLWSTSGKWKLAHKSMSPIVPKHPGRIPGWDLPRAQELKCILIPCWKSFCSEDLEAAPFGHSRHQDWLQLEIVLISSHVLQPSLLCMHIVILKCVPSQKAVEHCTMSNTSLKPTADGGGSLWTVMHCDALVSRVGS